MANFTRNGYGQVEPNQLSAQKTGQIYASLPLVSTVDVLQNGEFMFYDYANGVVNAEAVTDGVAVMGEPMLVMNEVKLYQEQFRTGYKDFAMIKVGENYVTNNIAALEYGGGAENNAAVINSNYRMDGIAPRMLKTNVGDIMTTNMLVTGVTYVVGDLLTPVANPTSHTMVLGKVPADAEDVISTMRWIVAKVTTMPDGQPGLKLQRVQ